MKLRAMEPQDTTRVLEFFGKHLHQAMFPLANLRDHGLCVQHETPPKRSMSAWIAEDGRGIQALLGVTCEGAVLPVMPTGDYGLWEMARCVLGGRSLIGFAGSAGPVRAGLTHLNLASVPARMSQDEPQYLLDLVSFAPLDPKGRNLKSIRHAPRDLMVRWRVAYGHEVLGLATPEQAETDISTYIRNDSHRVLFEGGKPLAMTGFNASTPECVQVGGVYTPPDLRGQGLASLALSMHLVEAAERGVRHATLFAASAGAARLYERLGFFRIGDYALVFFENPTVVPA